MTQLTGKVLQVIGPVVDIEFDIDLQELPEINDALDIIVNQDDTIVVECQ